MKAGLLLSIGLGILVVACGDGGAGPTPPPATLDGQWTMTWQIRGTTQGVAMSCRINGATFSITHTNATQFTGTQVGSATMTCTADGRTMSTPVSGSSLINGTYDAGAVHFDVDDPVADQTGSAAGTHMNGKAHWDLDLGPPYGVLELTGSWSAYR